MNYRNLDRLLQHCELQPGPVRFEIVVIYLVFLFFWALLRRSALTVGVMGGLSFLFAYINYTKVAVNGDNFFPQDMMMAGSAGELTSFISGGLPKWFWLGLAALVCWTIFLALTAADLRLVLPAVGGVAGAGAGLELLRQPGAHQNHAGPVRYVYL